MGEEAGSRDNLGHTEYESATEWGEAETVEPWGASASSGGFKGESERKIGSEGKQQAVAAFVKSLV